MSKKAVDVYVQSLLVKKELAELEKLSQSTSKQIRELKKTIDSLNLKRLEKKLKSK